MGRPQHRALRVAGRAGDRRLPGGRKGASRRLHPVDAAGTADPPGHASLDHPHGNRARADPSGNLVGDHAADAARRIAARCRVDRGGAETLGQLPGARRGPHQRMAAGRGLHHPSRQGRERRNIWLGQRVWLRGSQTAGIQGGPAARVQCRVHGVRRRRRLPRRIGLDRRRPRLAPLHPGRAAKILARPQRPLFSAESARRDSAAAELARGGQLPRGPSLLRVAGETDG